MPVAMIAGRCRVSHTLTLFPSMLSDGAWYQLGWRGLPLAQRRVEAWIVLSVRITERWAGLPAVPG